MSTELAVAYVSIVPSLKGAEKTISQQLARTNMAPAGRALGRNLSSNISKSVNFQAVGAKLQSVGKSLSSVGSRLTNSITKPAIGAATAVGGIAVALGFKRLVGIDTARAKLKALGHDSKSVQKIMDSALTSVKGTAYGLGDAANIAASAVAAGVDPGKKLTKYLTMTADAAAIAGTELNEMGSILNQVQTGQVAYTDSLNMLADRGIPIYQWLAEELGVTAGEVKKLASEGKISSEAFFSAIEENIGGAAKIVGESSFTGAFDNLKASLGRLGASFLDADGKGGGFFSQLKPTMTELTADIDAMGPAAEKLGVKFGEAFTKMVDKVKDLKAQWDDLDEATQSKILKIAGAALALGPVLMVLGSIGSAIGGIVSGFGALTGAGGLAGLAGKFLKVGGVIGIVVGLVAALWQKSDDFKTALTDAGEKLSKTFEDLKEDLQPVVDKIKKDLEPAIQSIGTSLGSVVTSATPMIQQMVSMFGTVMQVVGPLASMISRMLGPAFQNLADIVETVFGQITNLLGGIQKQWGDVAKMVGEISRGDWSSAWRTALGIVSRNVGAFRSTIESFVSVLGKILIGPVKTTLGAFGLSWDQASAMAREAFERLKKSVQAGIDRVVEYVRGIPARIRAAIPSPGGVLSSIGASIMGGLKSGILSGWENVKGTLNWITDRIPFEKGPKAKDAKLLTPAGQLVMKGFQKGLESGYKGVKSSLNEFTESLAKWQAQSVKKEADRLMEARRQANKKITASNKKLAKERDAALAKADKISDSKARAAAKKRARDTYKAKKKDSLGSLTRAEAEKQAKKNFTATAAAMKIAQALVKKQNKKTEAVWKGSKYTGSVERWQGMSLGTARILKDTTTKGNFKKSARASVKAITLADVGKAQDQVTKALTKAKETLASMKEARAQLKSQISESIKGELDLTAGIGEDTVVNGHMVKGKTTFASVASQVKSMAAKAKTFAQKLQALVKKGIPAGLVQEVASLGTENGTKVATALLSGSKTQVKSLSADYASLNSWSSKAGDYVAGQMYDTGINATAGLIKGLEKDSAKLEAVAKKLADKLTKAVKKALGIKSPSRVFRDEIGVMVDRGLSAGISGGVSERAAVKVAAGIQKPFESVSLGTSLRGDLAVPPVGPSAGVDSGRSLTDADVEALASAMSRARVVWAPSGRDMARFAQAGQTQLKRYQ